MNKALLLGARNRKHRLQSSRKSGVEAVAPWWWPINVELTTNCMR